MKPEKEVFFSNLKLLLLNSTLQIISIFYRDWLNKTQRKIFYKYLGTICVVNQMQMREPTPTIKAGFCPVRVTLRYSFHLVLQTSLKPEYLQKICYAILASGAVIRFSNGGSLGVIMKHWVLVQNAIFSIFKLKWKQFLMCKSHCKTFHSNVHTIHYLVRSRTF